MHLLLLKLNHIPTITVSATTDPSSKAAIKATIDYVKPIVKYLVFASGASVSETSFTFLKDNKRKAKAAFIKKLNAFVFDDEKNIELFGPLPNGFFTSITITSLDEHAEKNVYRLFKVMKCQFCNKWTLHIELRSGENLADMISRVVSKVWAEGRNIEFKKKGKPLTAMPN